jgi:hypothetical protein
MIIFFICFLDQFAFTFLQVDFQKFIKGHGYFLIVSFHLFWYYLHVFICIPHDKSDNTFFFGLFYHAWNQ